MVKQIKVAVPSGAASWGQELQQRESHHQVQASCLQGLEGINFSHVRENSTLISEIRDRRRKYYLKRKVEWDESFTGRICLEMRQRQSRKQNCIRMFNSPYSYSSNEIYWDFFYKTLSQAFQTMGYSQCNTCEPWIPPAGGSEETSTDCRAGVWP